MTAAENWRTDLDTGSGIQSMVAAQSQRLALVRTGPYRAITGAWTHPVALACSGGVDSTALLLLASEALRREKVAPFVVMHVDHRTRPETAAEADFVRGLCAERQIPFVPLQLDESTGIHGRSAEDVWRERRYAVLERAARRLGISTVVTAHTRDDQVETALMRLMMGSHRLGMPATLDRGDITVQRPLLNVSREELVKVLEIAGVEACEDPSNYDTSYRRNAVRHEIMPRLASVFPGYEDALIRSLSLRELDAAFADEQALDVSEALCQKRGREEITIARKGLAELHPAIASRVLRLAAQYLIAGQDDRELTFERIEAVRAAADSGRTGALLELPYGVRVHIERDFVRMQRQRED